MEFLTASLIDWSRAQFALTACYHWIFVPLTLGLGIVMAVMETLYVRTGKEEWKNAAKFWMRLFGINFAFGVATGLILEFQFGTNWSNYSWFVGDIFGAPLAIEATLAFFLEATFISLMFFGWNKLSRGMHLASTWLTILGATISALWILVANAWMQYPVGMEFNPDAGRNEMIDFWAILGSPVAINKFIHTVLSGWVLGGIFVVGVSGWFLLRGRHCDFARKSMKAGTAFGFASSMLILLTGHTSAMNVAEYQPMKLAAMEGHYDGYKGVELVVVGILNPDKHSYDDGVKPVIAKIAVPKMLSLLAFLDSDAYVPGIRNVIEGGYEKPDGTVALSFEEMQRRGRLAQRALEDYRAAVDGGDSEKAAMYKADLQVNYPWFGYGYLDKPEDLIPPVGLTFYSFHVMVLLGGWFILLFLVTGFFAWSKKRDIARHRWLLWLGIVTIPLGYLAGQFGWVVAEVGRQPWAIQDILPVQAAISGVSAGSVQTTFWIFAVLFTVLLLAEIRIMLQQIKRGPEPFDAEAGEVHGNDNY